MKKNIRNEYKITIKRNEFITQFECYLRNKKIRASKFADAYLRFLIYKEGDVCLFSPQPHQFYPFCFDKKINNKIKITISDEALNKDLIQYLTHNKCTVSDIFNALFYRMFCQNESQKLYQYLNLCFDSKSIHQINLEDGKPKNIIEINDETQSFNIEIPLLNANLEKIIKEMRTEEPVEQQKISQNKKIKNTILSKLICQIKLDSISFAA